MKPSLTAAATFLIFGAANIVIAQDVKAKYASSCAFLSKKIYCYGGIFYIEDVSMVTLDIFNNSGSTAEEMESKWALIQPNTPTDLNAREYPQHMQIDDKTLLISGGNNKATTRLTAQTATYNSETNSWKEYPEYQEGSYGNRQIYHASSVYIPTVGAVFYGGVEAKYLDNWTYQDVNVTKYEVKSSGLRYIGYPSLTFLNIENSMNPWSVFPAQSNLPAVFSFCQTSIYDEKSNRIFFFGGRYTDLVDFFQYDHTFANSITFDLVNSEWGSENMSGRIPSGRVYHTTNIVGPDQRDVLLYGGQTLTDDERAVLDYCYILNLDTYEWKQHNVTSSNSVLLRTKHSAVAVSKETIFIIFGRDASSTPTLSLLMLDVKDPSNITVMEKFVDTDPSSDSTLNLIKETKDDKLSTGATAGIAFGASAAGIIAIAVIVFCVLKQRKTKIRQQEIKESKTDRKDNVEEPVMEVDWDEIDNNYFEVTTKPIPDYGHSNHFKYPSQLADDKEALTGNSAAIPYVGVPTRTRDAITYQLPDAIDNNDGSSYNRNHKTTLKKPDST